MDFLSNLLASFGLGPSKEKLEKAEAYKAVMFPFGDEEKSLVSQNLQRAINRYPVNKTMFLFLTIKETYLNAEHEGLAPEACAEKAHRHSLKFHMVPADQLCYIFSFVMLEMHLDALTSMPDVNSVIQLQSRLFASGYEAPDWSALPERNQNDG